MSNEYVKIIKSTYKDAFLSHAGEGTSIAYILSEFLDNSITGYEQLQELSRKDKHDYRGLNINITFHRTDKGEEITIQDNGSGIIDTSGKNNPRKYLGEVMQPYFHNVKDQDKSQYGVGMKLAIFWLTRHVIIYSKTLKDKEYKLEINVTKDMENQEPHIEPIPSSDNEIKKVTGTKIILKRIYDGTDPLYENKIIESNEIQRIADIIGARYTECLEKGATIYVNFYGKKEDHILVKPFVLNPTNLTNASHWLILKNEKNDKAKCKSEFEKYLRQLKLPTDLTVFNKRDIKKDWLDNKNMCFIYTDHIWSPIQQKTVPIKVKWGILSYNENEKAVNWKNRNGMKLIHDHRAIWHAPNIDEDNTKFRLSAYPFVPDKKSGGDENVWRRLYGEIDLTGILSPEVNKRDFKWERSKTDLDTICKKIWDSSKSFINTINEVEKELTRIPKTNSSRATTAIKKATSAATNIEVVEAQGNITKLKEHKYTHGQTSFIVKYEDGGLDGKPFSIRVVSDKVIRVVVNSSHSMLHKLLNDHQMGVAFQTDIIFPLCVCFAICKLNFDGERKDICKQFKGMTFDEIISDILKGRDDT